VNAEAALDERRANDSRVARGEGKELGRVEVKVQEGARRAGNEAQLKAGQHGRGRNIGARPVRAAVHPSVLGLSARSCPGTQSL
jgi:hypothetical protein